MPPTERRAPLGNTTPTPEPGALAATCPLCGAQRGEPCQDAIGGWVRPVNPHHSRTAADVDPAGDR